MPLEIFILIEKLVKYKTKTLCILYVNSSPNSELRKVKESVENLEHINYVECWHLEPKEIIKSIKIDKKVNIIVDDLCINKHKNIEIILKVLFTKKYGGKFTLKKYNLAGPLPYERIKNIRCLQEVEIKKDLMFFDERKIKKVGEHAMLIQKIITGRNYATVKKEASLLFKSFDSIGILITKNCDMRSHLLNIYDKKNVVIYYQDTEALKKFFLFIIDTCVEIKNLEIFLRIVLEKKYS